MDWIRCPNPFHRDHAVRASRWCDLSIEVGFDRTDVAAHWAFEFIDWHLAPETSEFPILHTTCIQRSERTVASYQ
jgi:hypothetical protein